MRRERLARRLWPCAVMIATTASCSYAVPDAGVERSLESIEREEIPMVVDIKQKYAGKIDARRTGRDALEGSALVGKLLKEWEAIGASRAELTSILGEPTEKSDRVFEYRFDGGYDGDVWRFHFKDDRVSSVERIPME